VVSCVADDTTEQWKFYRERVKLKLHELRRRVHSWSRTLLGGMCSQSASLRWLPASSTGAASPA
jgi:hypothetical protein